MVDAYAYIPLFFIFQLALTRHEKIKKKKKRVQGFDEHKHNI
jgi:hypothetical protein